MMRMSWGGKTTAVTQHFDEELSKKKLRKKSLICYGRKGGGYIQMRRAELAK